MNLHFVTIHEMGRTNSQPLWFYYYDKSTKKLLIMAQNVRKVQNIWRKLNVYFVSTIRTFHTKDIKRQRFGNYSEDPKRILTIVGKINLKYLGTLHHLLTTMFIENARNGTHSCWKIINFFSPGILAKCKSKIL